MTKRPTFIKCSLAAVTIAAAAAVFSANDKAAAGDKHYSGYAMKAKAATLSSNSSSQSSSTATSTPNTPRQEGRGRTR